MNTMQTSHYSRRQFLGHAGATALGLLASSRAFGKNTPSDGSFVFLEAEGFTDHGGWELDQQSMDQMGSPYLLAHGLGRPVNDATTKATFPSTGKYRIWVRTRDWVAPWKAPGAPGKFQVLLDGKPVKETFGTKNAEWHWHDGGTVDISDKDTTVSLHDLTGFEGRCEAILFCKDTSFTPTNDVKALEKFRRKLLGLSDTPADGGEYEFVVVGAGLAGVCAAISAARHGVKVALIQDRPVLGGNASSEVRVWPEGHINQKPYTHIGDIVKEILTDLPKTGSMNGKHAKFFDDEKKMGVVTKEPNITLLTNYRAISTQKKGERISSVVIQSTLTGERKLVKGTLFADCTGDAVVGYQAGADYEYSVGNNMGMTNLWRPMDAAKEENVLKCECKDKDALTADFQEGKTEQPFPRCPWAIDLSDKPFPGRKNFRGQWGGSNPLNNLGGWFWESGFDKDMVEDTEIIRDLNFRAMYGAWDTLKNVDGMYPNHRLEWAAFIAGKRESRRLMGDVVLTADDFRQGKQWEDPAFPCSWHIDLHVPHEKFDDELKGQEFISKATAGKEYSYKGPYWAPYRTLYSRNIENLFMAGRDISVSKDGLGPVRVMRTTGMMGETVGKAAALCIKHQANPRGIYQKHLDELKKLMQQPGSERSA
ncbi:FAD dependent oxidoreductase [Rubritalea squalenifaciens DSM 18772]|uniref:FAD dependent oxidoreductase n=2 Tax=Rubritalea squalenifaciens TaxID=407226 RepID=A0A1M6CWX0_9BACT|nr:FAD dependent oxidoreductase [Rubritalea squalenifaciens DSM 18772]